MRVKRLGSAPRGGAPRRAPQRARAGARRCRLLLVNLSSCSSPPRSPPTALPGLAERRALHARQVLRVAVGDSIQAGVLGGRMGGADVLAASEHEVVIAPRLNRDPPPPAPVTLLAAVPRPEILGACCRRWRRWV